MISRVLFSLGVINRNLDLLLTQAFNRMLEEHISSFRKRTSTFNQESTNTLTANSLSAYAFEFKPNISFLVIKYFTSNSLSEVLNFKENFKQK